MIRVIWKLLLSKAIKVTELEFIVTSLRRLNLLCIFVNLLIPINVVLSENTAVVLVKDAELSVYRKLIGKVDVIAPMVILFLIRITVRLKKYK